MGYIVVYVRGDGPMLRPRLLGNNIINPIPRGKKKGGGFTIPTGESFGRVNQVFKPGELDDHA